MCECAQIQRFHYRYCTFCSLTLLLLEEEDDLSWEDVDELDEPDDEDPESDSEEEESRDDDLFLVCFSSLFVSLPLL